MESGGAPLPVEMRFSSVNSRVGHVSVSSPGRATADACQHDFRKVVNDVDALGAMNKSTLVCRCPWCRGRKEEEDGQ